MRQHLELGTAPTGETCAQVGDPNYYEKSMRETSRYIRLLKKMFPNAPDDVVIKRKSFSHDFGTYYEVVIYTMLTTKNKSTMLTTSSVTCLSLGLRVNTRPSTSKIAVLT